MTDLTPEQRRRSLTAAIAVATIAGIGISMLFPLLSLALEEMGAATTTIGLLATVGSLATLGITPLIPRLLRVLGTLPVLFGATLVAIGCTLAFHAWPAIWIWFPLRFVNSAALVLLFVVSEIWVNQLAEPHNRGRVLAIYVAFFSGGGALGPALLYVLGTTGWLPYLAAAGLMAAAAVPLLLVRGITPTFDDSPSMAFRSFLVAAPIAAFAALVYGAAEPALLQLLPIYAVRAGRTPEAAALLLSLFGVGNVALQFPIGWLSDRLALRSDGPPKAAAGLCMRRGGGWGWIAVADRTARAAGTVPRPLGRCRGRDVHPRPRRDRRAVLGRGPRGCELGVHLPVRARHARRTACGRVGHGRLGSPWPRRSDRGALRGVRHRRRSRLASGATFAPIA